MCFLCLHTALAALLEKSAFLPCVSLSLFLQPSLLIVRKYGFIQLGVVVIITQLHLWQVSSDVGCAFLFIYFYILMDWMLIAETVAALGS